MTWRFVYYAAHARTLAELRDELWRIGPLGDNAHHDANATRNLAWHYPYVRRRGSCATGPVRVEVDIVETYPVWLPPEPPMPEVAIRWDRWRRNLEAHEAVHRTITIGAARKLATELAAVPAARTCKELERVMDALGTRLLEELDAAQTAYDRDTQHGMRTTAQPSAGRR